MTQASPLTSTPMPTSARHVATPQGGRLVAVAGQLPLRSAALAVDASAGLARVKLEQVFENPHAEPLRVKYVLPLPADAAVSGFAFRIGNERIVGSVDEVKKARETFERAISEGRTAAILEETRTSLFAQELGNVPAGATVIAEIQIDQPLAWIDVEGSWEWRFPLAAAPRYLGDTSGTGSHERAGRTPDAGRMMLDVTTDETGVRARLALAIGDALVPGRSPESPSHPLQIDTSGAGLGVTLGGGGSAALDRDLVVRWPVALASSSLTFQAARSGGRPGGSGEELCALLTIVPPVASPGRDAKRVPRDLVLLLDTSGSMEGEPLAQAQRIASALVSSLDDADGLELIEFSSAPRRFRRESVRATAAHREAALAWIQGLRASGGTEMLDGITEALAGLRAEAQRQVVVVTDGLIGFERDVVSAIQRKLPRGSRVHAVGVGSSTNRTLLAGVARVGGGVEVVVGLGEDPERAAQRVLARTVAPVIVDLSLEGPIAEHAPQRLPDLYTGAPARIAVRVAPEGGAVVVRGRAADGPWQARVVLPPRAEVAGHDAPAKLFARERAADLEAALSSGRDKASVDRELVELGVRYQIATRVTAWVAATDEVTVDPTEPTRRESVPHVVPFGMSATGLGLRAPAAAGLGLHAPAAAGTTYALRAQLAEADDEAELSLARMPSSFAGAPPPPPPAMPVSYGAPPRPPAYGAAPPPMQGRARSFFDPAETQKEKRIAPPEPAAPAASGPVPSGAPPLPQAPRLVMPAPYDPADTKPGFADEGGAAEALPADRDERGLLADEPAPREAPPTASFLGGLAQKVRDFFAPPPPIETEATHAAEGEAQEQRAKGEARPAASAGPNVRVVPGRGTMLGDRELTVEIDVEGAPLDLTDLLLDVKLVTKLGAHLAGRVKVTASTRPGTYAAGTTVRIVVMLEEAPASDVVLAFFISAKQAAPVIRVELVGA